MKIKRLGRQTVSLPFCPAIISCANVVGAKEGAGPLKKYFDCVNEDSLFGQKTWEKAESQMQKLALQAAMEKAGIATSALSYILQGIY